MDRYKAILDFMSNGYEHGSDDDNRAYLKDEFNLNDEQVDNLRKSWPCIRDTFGIDEGIEIVKTALI